MLWIKDFVRKYPQAVVTGVVPIGNIMEKLKRAYGAEEVPPEQIPSYRVRDHLENAYYYAHDDHPELSREDLSIKELRIPVTEQTRHYTEQDFVPWDDEGTSGAIYVIYEERTGYFYCNSSKLHLEIAMARGVSQEDVQQQTENYRVYLWQMQNYIETYSDFGMKEELVWSQEMELF